MGTAGNKNLYQNVMQYEYIQHRNC